MNLLKIVQRKGTQLGIRKTTRVESVSMTFSDKHLTMENIVIQVGKTED